MDKRDRKKNIECTIAEVTDSNVYGVDSFVENVLVIDQENLENTVTESYGKKVWLRLKEKAEGQNI